MDILNKITMAFDKNKAPKVQNERTLKFAESVGVPYSLCFPADHRELMGIYRQKLAEGREKGFVPLFVVVDDMLLSVLEDADDNETLKDCSALDGIDGKAELEAMWNAHTQDSDEFHIQQLIGGETEGVKVRTILPDRCKKRGTDIVLFEMPVAEAWQAVGWFDIGGWNDCPETKTIMAVAKYWQEKHGATVMTITACEMEFHVENKLGHDDALETAKEHFAFCPDRAYQCTSSGTISEIADSLTQSTIWYFWWD